MRPGRAARAGSEVSVGCAAWPVDQTGWEVVLAAAETALHQAKRAGRNRVEAVSLPW